MITLRQLRYLTALARHRHFGRAAEDCAVTQPALSMQVRELEREIGAELVERRPGDIALTETGLDVAQRAEQILAATRDLVDFARHRDVLSGRLLLGIIPTLAPYILPRVLPRLQAEYPQLRLEVRETQTKLLLEELAGGELDAVMLALPVEGADVETLALFDDAFLLAVPAADTLPRAPRRRRGRRSAPADFAGGGPLPARSGAGVLRAPNCRAARAAGEPRRHLARDGDADGGERLRRDAAAAGRGRRRRARRRASSCCASPSRSRRARSVSPGGAPRRAARISRRWGKSSRRRSASAVSKVRSPK